MYRWRKLNERQKREVLDWRKAMKLPLHSPPHFDVADRTYLMTASCYEHAHIIGQSSERMNEFTAELLKTVTPLVDHLHAWVVLPNHYHLVVHVQSVSALIKELGQMHGRTSFRWNGEDGQRGRKVWHNCTERMMRGNGHYLATLNYVHHNPVKHQYVEKWQEWPWGSVHEYLEAMPKNEVERRWREYNIDSYGKGWDED